MPRAYPVTKHPLIEPDALYEQIVASGATIEHHESDLYTPVTPELTALLARYRFAKGVTTFTATEFSDASVQRKWYCIPFAYKPFWDARRCRDHG